MIRVERGVFTAVSVARCDGCHATGPRHVDSASRSKDALELRAAARALEKGWRCCTVTGVAWCPQCSGVRPGPLSGARVEGSWIGLAGPGGEVVS